MARKKKQGQKQKRDTSSAGKMPETQRRYSIEFTTVAEKDLAALDQKNRRIIVEKIANLAETPRPPGVKKIEGDRNPPLYRIRSGDYRVIYSIDDRAVTVLVIRLRHRREVYQGL